MFSLSNARAMFVLLISLGFSSLTHAAYTGLYSFGDSLSDTGNVFAATASPPFPYFDGNFSNGSVWTDLLGSQLGLAPPQASLDGGTNYAWGGARTTVDSVPFPPSTATQVGTYLTDAGGVADPNALYTIWTGGNDINAVVGGAPFTDLADAGLAVATIADDLLSAGAQNILVVNVPNLGLTPGADGNEGGAEFLSVVFNDNLALGLANLGSANITFLDSFSLLQTIVDNPAAFGLTNVDDNCLATTGGLGSACDGYLFWDDLHPTADGHQLIADAAYAAVVPVPAAAWLFGSALLGLAGLSRRRA
jgi:phospholipase/lecithinase/hemolysin